MSVMFADYVIGGLRGEGEWVEAAQGIISKGPRIKGPE